MVVCTFQQQECKCFTTPPFSALAALSFLLDFRELRLKQVILENKDKLT